MTDVVRTSTDCASKKLTDSQNGIASVSGAMQELGSMMSETAASMEKIQDAAIRVTETAERMVDATKEGNQYMDAAKERATEIQLNVKETQQEAMQVATHMAESVHERIEQAQAVSAIAELSQTIITIAKQSNLLAINAAIEAARAGESGRGFAVVADEISTLATTSKAAAEEINRVCESAISSVNGLADAAKEVLNFISERIYRDYDRFVENGTRYYEDAVQMRAYMEDFTNKTEELNRAVLITQEAIGNISAAIEQGSASITTVADTSTKLNSQMDEVMTVTKENEIKIEKLKESVSKFVI